MPSEDLLPLLGNHRPKGFWETEANSWITVNQSPTKKTVSYK